VSVAQHGRGDFGYFGERCHRLGRFALLNVSNHGVDEHHNSDHQRINRPTDTPLNDPRTECDGNGGQQQVNKRILKVRQHAPPAGQRRRRTQFIGAVGGQPRCRLLRRESIAQVSGDCCHNIVGATDGRMGGLASYRDVAHLKPLRSRCG
jgi:hypothetical protein